jgi:hypothetical protein
VSVNWAAECKKKKRDEALAASKQQDNNSHIEMPKAPSAKAFIVRSFEAIAPADTFIFDSCCEEPMIGNPKAFHVFDKFDKPRIVHGIENRKHGPPIVSAKIDKSPFHTPHSQRPDDEPRPSLVKNRMDALTQTCGRPLTRNSARGRPTRLQRKNHVDGFKTALLAVPSFLCVRPDAAILGPDSSFQRGSCWVVNQWIMGR